MTKPRDGMPTHLAHQLAELTRNLGAGTLMCTLRRNACGCRLATVKRVHGVDVLAGERRSIVAVSADRDQARRQLFVYLLNDPDGPVSLSCGHGDLGLVDLNRVRAHVEAVARGETRREVDLKL